MWNVALSSCCNQWRVQTYIRLRNVSSLGCEFMKNNELVKRTRKSKKTSFITLKKQFEVKSISGKWKRRLSQQALYWMQNAAEDLKICQAMMSMTVWMNHWKVYRWPPRSPDFTTCENWLWFYLKENLGRIRMNSVEQFKGDSPNLKYNHFRNAQAGKKTHMAVHPTVYGK